MTLPDLKAAFATWLLDGSPEAFEALVKGILDTFEERVEIDLDLDKRLRRIERRLELALAPLQDREAVANRLSSIELALATASSNSVPTK